MINVPDEGCRSVVDFLRDRHVDVTKLGEAIVKDEENCLHCGACVSVCPVGAHVVPARLERPARHGRLRPVRLLRHACPVSVLKLSSP